MSTWTIRHEGSPRSIENLSLQQVVEGLREGLWEPTDEVKGPGETTWAALENHPQLAEVIADLEPPEAKVHPDETHLDMNPLIDVALVLLIFFILTATVQALHTALDAPKYVTGNLPSVPQQKANATMIRVNARLVKDKPVITVDGKPVELEDLKARVSEVKDKTNKQEMLIDADDAIGWQTVITIRDAAAGAHIQKIYFLAKK